MPTVQELLDELDSALNPGLTTSYTSASNANDVFEGFVFSLIVAAAREQGAQITFEDVGGAAATHLVFRTSPGNIYSATQAYTHARIAFPRCPELEAHVGVYVAGKSGVIHECDAAVVERSEAQICRREGVHPRNSKILLAAECKFYAGTLHLGQARGFLGLLEELTKRNRFLVTNTTSDTAERMINHHKAEREFRLDLSDPRIARRLQTSFEKVFRDFQVARRT